ncbi:MAG: hypothetical protein ACYC0T_11015 [Ramlibacter sp.]
MRHRDPSPASVTHASRVLAVLRETAGAATASGVAAGFRPPVHAPSPTFQSASPRDPIAIAIAAASLAVPTAGAFMATEDVAAGMALIVLAWVPLVACCLDLLQATWNERVRRKRWLAARIDACPAPQGRGASSGTPSARSGKGRGCTESAGADGTGIACAPSLSQAPGPPFQTRRYLPPRDAPHAGMSHSGAPRSKCERPERP